MDMAKQVILLLLRTNTLIKQACGLLQRPGSRGFTGVWGERFDVNGGTDRVTRPSLWDC